MGKIKDKKNSLSRWLKHKLALLIVKVNNCLVDGKNKRQKNSLSRQLKQKLSLLIVKVNNCLVDGEKLPY